MINALMPASIAILWSVIGQAARSWVDHKDGRAGAALAYYSVFSFGPVMVIAIAIAGSLFGRDAAQGEVERQLRDLLGDTAVGAVHTLLESAEKSHQGVVATIIGTIVLLFSAVGVVVELKATFNTIWQVDPHKISGAWQFIRAYLVSLAAILAVGFLLLVSLVFTAVLSAAGQYINAQLPEGTLQATGSLISFVVIAVVFAMMFKYLPDTRVEWRDVGVGAAITAALFEIGKLLIGLYIGRMALNSIYGAAASLVVLLIWVYYTAQIVLFGAEFTHVHASRHRSS
jgi:membrane protein